MSFERHHPNPKVDRNLSRARDLRGAYILASLSAIAEFIARAWRAPRRSPMASLEMPAGPIGKQAS